MNDLKAFTHVRGLTFSRVDRYVIVDDTINQVVNVIPYHWTKTNLRWHWTSAARRSGLFRAKLSLPGSLGCFRWFQGLAGQSLSC